MFHVADDNDGDGCCSWRSYLWWCMVTIALDVDEDDNGEGWLYLWGVYGCVVVADDDDVDDGSAMLVLLLIVMMMRTARMMMMDVRHPPHHLHDFQFMHPFDSIWIGPQRWANICICSRLSQWSRITQNHETDYYIAQNNDLIIHHRLTHHQWVGLSELSSMSCRPCVLLHEPTCKNKGKPRARRNAQADRGSP